MQREEKQYEMTLDAVLLRLNDLKLSITSMIRTLETEFEIIDWPTFLGNFAVISSHLTSLSKLLSKEQCPLLRNRTVLPLMLTPPEREESLVELTEGRVPMFAHDVVPDYLRTKPDLLTEQKMIQNEQKASSLSTEAAMKQVTQYNKVISHIHDMLSKAREEWDSEAARSGIQQTSSMADTQSLVAAITVGKGLRPMTMPGGPNGPGGSMMVPPAMRAPTPMNAGNPGSSAPMSKAPAGIKTNIKSAMQVHNFNR